MIDVMDLSEQDLAAIVGVMDVQTVAAATGLPVGYLGLLVATTTTPAPEYERRGCPRCGHSSSTRYQPHQRCRYCRHGERAEQVDAARSVLACGMDGDEARHALEDAGYGPTVARKLLTDARRKIAA